MSFLRELRERKGGGEAPADADDANDAAPRFRKRPRRAGGAAAAKPAKKKGRGKGRQQPKNAWRVRGGRRVYFDATGKQLTGAAAMVAYRRANGGGS